MIEDVERKRAIAARFGAHARDYESHAGLQRDIAARLARHLPAAGRVSDILEIGCGTGFLTGHMFGNYAGARFLVTDLAPEMVEVCSRRYSGDAEFRVMDGESPDCEGPFDLIATSMTPQWFLDPATGLSRLAGLLRPGGALYYATLGPRGFTEWRSALDAEGVAAGTVDMPALPGVFEEEHRTIAYGSGRDFLAAMREIGAGEARAGYRAVPPGSLRRALRRLEACHGSRVTWHIVYGRIAAPA